MTDHIEHFEAAMRDDRKECAYVRLCGATERLGLVLKHRSERNYDVAVASVVAAHAEYLTFVSGELKPGAHPDDRC